MAKRTPAKTHKRKPKTSGGTPRRGDRLKIARKRFGTELTKNNEPPVDLEPDGNAVGTRDDSLSVYNSDDTATAAPSNAPRREDRLKIARKKFGTELTENNEPPADLEPDGSPVGTRDDALTVYDSDDTATTEPSTVPLKTTAAQPTKKKQNKKQHNLRSNSRNKIDDVMNLPSPDADTIIPIPLDIPTPPCPPSSPPPTEVLDLLTPDASYMEESDEESELDNRSPINQPEIDDLINDRDEDLQDITLALKYGKDDDDSDEPEPMDDDKSDDTDVPLSSLDKRKKKTYAESANGSDGNFNPARVDPDCSIRYGLRINIPAHPKPLEQILKAIKMTLKTAQQAIQGTIGIAPWDEKSKEKTIKNPKDFPSGTNIIKDKEVLQLYFDHFWRATPNKEYTAFMKIRFVTAQPTTSLAWPLAQLGSYISRPLLGECLNPAKDNQITLSPRPLACQAAKVISVGWLFGSVKSMNEATFVPALRTYLCVPQEVSLGVSWKVMRNSQKKTPKWEEGVIHPQALHLEIDAQYYGQYAPAFATLWKKRPKHLICGLQLRLVPCFTSPRMTAADDNTKSDAMNMALKQQHFVNHHIVRLPPCTSIAFLDKPLSKNSEDINSEWTLRRYIMKAAPEGYPSQRLFVTVDESWDGNGFQLVTVSLFYIEAERAINNMIPECLHTYGAPAAKWFTNSGLHAFKNNSWNPDSRRTTSTDRDITDCVEENFFGMSNKWKPAPPTTRIPHNTTPSIAVLNPSVLASTAREIIEQRHLAGGTRSDQSVSSFGDRVFDRDHDGDTVRTTAPALASANPIPLNTPTVQIDLTGMELEQTTPGSHDDDSISMSTMARTTESTRRTLKATMKQVTALSIENEEQSRQRAESEQKAASLQSELDLMRQQLLALQSNKVPAQPTNKKKKQVTLNSAHHDQTPSAAHGDNTTDTAAAGIGRRT